MISNVYCTYFNQSYLNRGIVLFRSLAKFESNFIMEVLCFDDFTYDFLCSHPFGNIRPVRLSDFESRNPALLAVKPSRTAGEYYFTCTSVWTLDVMSRNGNATFITYLDADMRFFSSPVPIFNLMEDKDIMICEHHFERNAEKLSTYGRFNVGWITFRTSETGCECLRRWATDCIAWCYDRLEDGKFADQKYLDEWPNRYGNKLIIAPKSLNLGPWGIGKDELTVCGNTPVINGEPVILYHYQGLRLFSERHYYLGYYYHHQVSNILIILCEPYITELISVAREFNLECCRPNSRYSNGSLPYRLFTGYWMGHARVADFQRMLQQLFR